MQLTATERLAFAEILPVHASISDQVFGRDIAKKAELSAEEGELIELNTNKCPVCGGTQGKTTVHPTKAKELVKDIEFTDPETVFLKGRISELDQKKTVTPMALSLILKIQDMKAKTDA